MTLYIDPAKREKRARELAEDIIKGGVRYGGMRWSRLVALVGLSSSDMDYEPGYDDEFCPERI